MSYVSGNPKTKKALKEMLASGKSPRVFQPGLGTIPDNGTVYLEGPHYPAPHTWYATGTMENGKLVKVDNQRLVLDAQPKPMTFGAVLEHKQNRKK